VRLFEALEVPELAEILMLGAVKEYPEGSVIFEDGSPGDSFFVIYDGAVRISKMFQQMGEEALTILGAGEFFGEMSFFDDDPRSARAIAHKKAKLLEIRNAELKSHLTARPDVALKFLWAFSRTLSQRVRDTNAKFAALFAISRVF
jgi:CRP-like cAMP-binding protein